MNGNDFKIAGNNPLELHQYPRFFVTDIPAAGSPATSSVKIAGEDAAHAKNVLRMRAGDIAVLCDGRCHEAVATLTGYADATAIFCVTELYDSAGESCVPLTLYFASMKSDKNEFTVQKAVELGAARIVPLLTKRCISRPDEKSMRHKILRYRKIAYEAAKQCGRGIIPEVREFTDFSKMLENSGLSEENQGIMFYELAAQTDRVNFKSPEKLRTVSVITGCEGGFTPEEAEAASRAGFSLCTLGRRILRAETAPVAALTLVLHELNEL